MSDNIIQVGIETTGAEQAQSAANQAAQGIQNVGNAASESASQTQNFGAATGEATSLLDRLILMAKEAGQALLGMGTNAAEAGAEVKESMVGAGEAVTTLAEKAKLAGGSFSAMGAAGGLGALLGIGAASGLVAEALNSVMEKAEKMEHMAWVSGDSVEQIAELQAEAAKYGITLDNLGMTLTKIDQMVTKYREGDAETVKIVKELGIHHTDLVGVLTDLDKSWSQAIDKEKFVSDVKKELGRNVYDMLVLFSAEQGHLETNMKGHEDYAASVKKLAEEKQNLNVIEAKMSEEWTSLASDVMPILSAGLQIFIALWKSLVEIISTVTVVVIASLSTIIGGLGGMAKVAYDLMHGNFAAAKNDAIDVGEKISIAWKAAAKVISDSAADANKAWKSIGETAEKVKPPELPAGDKNLGAPGADPKAVNAAEKVEDEKLKIALESAQRQYEAAVKSAEQKFNLNEISESTEIDALKTAAETLYNIEQDNIEKRLALHKNEPEEVVRLNGELEKANDQKNSRISEADFKNAEYQKKQAEEALKFQIAWSKMNAFEAEENAKRQMQFTEMWMKPYLDAILDKMQADEVYATAKMEADRKLMESQLKLDLEAAKYDPKKQAQIIADYTARIVAIDKEIKALAIRNAEEAGGPHKDENVAKATTKGDSTIAADSDKGASQTLKVWQQVQKEQNALFDTMSNKVSSTFTSWLTGAEGFRQAFGKMLQSMESTFLQSLIKMGLDWVKHLAMKTTMNEISIATQNAQTAAGAATAEGIEKASTLKSIFMAAKNAYAHVSANAGLNAIPVVGPAIAQAAGVAAFAGIMALAAFEQGGITGNDESLALLHPHEMVLPKHISESVQNMAANGGTSSGSGDTHVHFHVNAIDGKNAANFIHNNRESIAKSVKRSIRDGRQFQYA